MVDPDLAEVHCRVSGFDMWHFCMLIFYSQMQNDIVSENLVLKTYTLCTILQARIRSYGSMLEVCFQFLSIWHHSQLIA